MKRHYDLMFNICSMLMLLFVMLLFVSLMVGIKELLFISIVGLVISIIGVLIYYEGGI